MLFGMNKKSAGDVEPIASARNNFSRTLTISVEEARAIATSALQADPSTSSRMDLLAASLNVNLVRQVPAFGFFPPEDILGLFPFLIF
jgi:hypothetical protein